MKKLSEKTNKQSIQILIDRCKAFEVKAQSLIAVNPSSTGEVVVWSENVKKILAELVDVL